MPRQPRLDAPGTLHHVMGRGIEHTKIFTCNTDREDFLKRIVALCQAGYMTIYAWVLMDNHFHLLLRTGNRPVSTSMRKILTGYVVKFNRRHKRYGHLFQNRYKSIICEDDPYLLELTRYIHLNPIRGGMVSTIDALDKYPWSGHAVVTGTVKGEWQDTETVLAYFGRRRREAIKRYRGFVADGVAQGRRDDLVGGGLLRSAGGWSQVLSRRSREDKIASDERILGSSLFVQSIISEASERENENLRLSLKRNTLSSIAKVISARDGIEQTALRSGNRRRDLARSRKIFCQLAVKRLGYSGAEVARYLGVTTSAVNRMANAEELPAARHYLRLLSEPTSPSGPI